VRQEQQLPGGLKCRKQGGSETGKGKVYGQRKIIDAGNNLLVGFIRT
jgi:hypothetical protein